MKRIDDFYLEEVILYELQQHIMRLEESGRLLQEEKECAVRAAESLRQECRAAGGAIEKAKAKRMADFEAYVLGEKKSYDASMESLERLRKKYEGLREQLSAAEDKVREYDRMKVQESFPVMKLTAELMDEYVERVEVHPNNEIKVIWK